MTQPARTPELQRLIKLLGLTTSMYDGEKLSALSKALEFMQARKWTWDDILLQPQARLTDKERAAVYEWGFKHGMEAGIKQARTEAARQATQPPKPEPPPDYNHQLNLCLRFIDSMTPWERGFLESMKLMSKNGWDLSDRQKESFDRVHGKARRCYYYEYGEYP